MKKAIMKKRLIITSLIFVIAISMTLMGACSSDDSGTADENTLTGEVTIVAAASLENTLEQELNPLFKEANPEVVLTPSYGGSGALQEQIEGGLNAGIFISAATKQMDALLKGEFVESSNVANILQNEVVLIKAKGKETEVNSFENIGEASIIAIGDPASVPAGQYAEEILKNIDEWDDVEAKLSLGTDVTNVLNWVAEGNAEVGIVYKTDAMSMSDKVEIIATASEDELETPVIYPIGMLNNVDEQNADATKAYFDFLQSEEALNIFKVAGFTILENSN